MYVNTLLSSTANILVFRNNESSRSCKPEKRLTRLRTATFSASESRRLIDGRFRNCILHEKTEKYLRQTQIYPPQAFLGPSTDNSFSSMAEVVDTVQSSRRPLIERPTKALFANPQQL